MSSGFGGIPVFAQDDTSGLPTDLLGLGQAAQASAQDQSVPSATPPGFTGYTPPTPPTGAPTPVLNPNAAATGASLISALGPNSAEAATPSMSDRDALIASARRIGADPLDLATVMSYETGGTMSPSQYGGAGGRHVGLIQFGPTEQQAYGASAGQSFQDQLPTVERYLTDRGFQPGMRRLDLYSTINAGHPGLYGASDAGNGGAPGNVADKVASMAPHEAKAAAFLGGNFQPQMPTGGQPRSMTPGIAAPMDASMGSTAQQGGFGLGGVVGQGSAVPGQSSPTPDAASLAGQPTALDGSQGQQEDASPYGGIASALKSIAGGQQKQGQKAAGGGGMAPPKMDGRAMTLQQARQQFEASRFYSMLPRGGRAG
ncbi:hypothetical protein MKK69_10395 [Methylobacterium sp. J-026]|uniref:hypothetical protein n=1 Tax=Methylobacterium sp. J-026 TaxID=2836624 RepID=UPI001FBAB989|nr:hypothetical protein [Methylobacterium sp. J-026]MCJ2134456.1 hypothetical protein [Methylobacterium sp. J-026]